MTDETRETLSDMLTYRENGLAHGMTIFLKEVAALRDVLTPRTCGTCRHAKAITEHDQPGAVLLCMNDDALGSFKDRDWTVELNDGCLLGWQAREGEGGGHV